MQLKSYKCVYIIKCVQTKLIKIGISENWYSRAKALKVGTKTTPILVVATEENRSAERVLHEYFNKQRLPGSEYFYLNTSQVSTAINIALQYGATLPHFHQQPTESLSPERDSLENGYIEITKCVHFEFERDIRLTYRNRGRCILECLEIYVGKQNTRYFTVLLDTQVQNKKLKHDSRWYIEADWALRLKYVEEYATRFFKLFRIYTTTKAIVSNQFKLETLLFTTTNTSKIITFNQLPLAAQILFLCTWSTDVFKRVYKAKEVLDRPWNYQKDTNLHYYLSNFGPYYYTKGKPLPMPAFHGIV
jgi:hypothetical protein